MDFILGINWLLAVPTNSLHWNATFYIMITSVYYHLLVLSRQKLCDTITHKGVPQLLHYVQTFQPPVTDHYFVLIHRMQGKKPQKTIAKNPLKVYKG
jgi:hypothetical protein